MTFLYNRTVLNHCMGNWRKESHKSICNSTSGSGVNSSGRLLSSWSSNGAVTSANLKEGTNMYGFSGSSSTTRTHLSIVFVSVSQTMSVQDRIASLQWNQWSRGVNCVAWNRRITADSKWGPSGELWEPLHLRPSPSSDSSGLESMRLRTISGENLGGMIVCMISGLDRDTTIVVFRCTDSMYWGFEPHDGQSFGPPEVSFCQLSETNSTKGEASCSISIGSLLKVRKTKGPSSPSFLHVTRSFSRHIVPTR